MELSSRRLLTSDSCSITETLLTTDESRHFPRFEDSGFVPIIPPTIDSHPIISLHSDPHINPILASQKYFSSHYRNGYLSTSRPFSLRHISSTSTLNDITSSTHAPPYDQSILGSGDFAVLRGGTFYTEDEEKRSESPSSFFDSHASRPFALPLEQSHHSDDPFVDFKDFAEITGGVDSDFTNLVVIYANKNSTKHEPRNILEQLQLLDHQKESEYHETEVPSSVPIKNIKLSKHKTKLLITKPPKGYYNKKVQVPKYIKQSKETTTSSSLLSNDYADPLVADS